MADKDTDTELKNAAIPGEEATSPDREREDRPDPPKDVRGALRAAIREHAEKDVDKDADDEADSKDDKSNERVVAKDKRRATGDNGASKLPKGASKDRSEDKEDEPEETETPEGEISPKEVKKEEVSIDPPPYYKNKGKAVWDKLSADEKNLIVAREQEVSSGFQQVSQRLKAFDEMEKVLAPRAQTIQQFGVSQAQVVDRLFQWMEHLGSSNPNVKASAFKQLAANFGLDLEQLTPGLEDIRSPEQSNQPPAYFDQFSRQMQEEVGALKETLATQQRAAADAYMANWAKDKEYYGQVSQLMHSLLVGGAIPMKNGNLDLDGAYEAAIKLHPEIAAQIQQKQKAQAEADAKLKAQKAAKERADKLAASRKASAGLKPAAPTMPLSSSPNPKSNGQKLSVRDSLRASLDELRE